MIAQELALAKLTQFGLLSMQESLRVILGC